MCISCFGKKQDNTQEQYEVLKIRSRRISCAVGKVRGRSDLWDRIFRVRAVLSCCGTRNSSLAVRSQNFDRCHSSPSFDSAAGGGRARPHFDTAPYAFFKRPVIIAGFLWKIKCKVGQIRKHPAGLPVGRLQNGFIRRSARGASAFPSAGSGGRTPPPPSRPRNSREA